MKASTVHALLAAPPAAPQEMMPEFSPALFAYSKILRRGAYPAEARSAISSLQTILAFALGTQLSIDGQFGEETDLAVRAFQARARISVDGIVGPETRDAIRELLALARAGTPDSRWDAAAISRMRELIRAPGIAPEHAGKSEPWPTWAKVLVGGALVVGGVAAVGYGYTKLAKHIVRKGSYR